MAKDDKVRSSEVEGKYRHVDLASLDRGRRGKHHDLVENILKELKQTAPGSALQIPLDQVGNVELANLRSAVHRGASAAGIPIQTLADEKNFYVWSMSAE